MDEFYLLYNVNNQAINGIITKLAAATGGPHSRTSRRSATLYAACMNTDLIEKKDLAPHPAAARRNRPATGKGDMPLLAGKLQRIGVNAFFSYGEMQDFKDASKQIAFVDQGGLGLPERDYYLRTGDKDKLLRDQYVAHITKMLSLPATRPPRRSPKPTPSSTSKPLLANASQDVTTRRDPEAIYHLEPIATFQKSIPFVNFNAFLDGIHSPKVAELNVTNIAFFPAMREAILSTDIDTVARLPALPDPHHLRHIAAAQAHRRRKLRLLRPSSSTATPEQRPALEALLRRGRRSSSAKRWARSMSRSTSPPPPRPRRWRWSPTSSTPWTTTSTRSTGCRRRPRSAPRKKLVAVANKIGYPDKWRDYTNLTIVARRRPRQHRAAPQLSRTIASSPRSASRSTRASGA